MRFPLIALVFLSAAAIASAEDIRTTDGTVYKNATISRVEKDGINILHSTGAAKIPFEKLSSDIQARYHYDANAAQTYRKSLEDARRTQAAEAQKQVALQQKQAAERRAAQTAEAQRRTEELKAYEAKAAEDDRVKQRNENIERAVKFVLLLGLCLLIYFLPSFVGSRKANSLAIFILNLLAGWTLVGWILAMVWACTKEPHELATHQAGKEIT